MSAALLPLALAVLTIALPGEDWRERFLRAAVVFGAAVAIVTEALSALTMLRPGALAIVWAVIVAAGVALAVRRRRQIRFAVPELSGGPGVWIC